MKKLSEILENKGITSDGKKVEINTPKRLRGDSKAFIVYRPTDKKDKDTGLTKVRAIKFGDPNLSVKNDDKVRVKSFWARQKCDTKKDKDTAGYWACYSPERFGDKLKLKGGKSRW